MLILGIWPGETEADLLRFRSRTEGDGVGVLWAVDSGIAQALGVQSLDTTIFFDAEGRVAYADAWPTDHRTLVAVTEALLAS